MFEIRCSDCGKTVRVSFQPEVSKPFYCKTCFGKYMSRETETVGRDSRFGSRQAGARRGENAQGEIGKNLLVFSSSTSARMLSFSNASSTFG